MDRIIEVKVNGSYITKDNRNAGVQHEANSTSLRIEFDPSWDSYAKKITWWNAKGEDPVEITLGIDLLEDAASSTRIYLCPIPGEPLAECGECTFVIDGYTDGKRQRSAADRLWVKEAPFKETAGQPSDPTPSQAEQLQKEIDEIKGTISQSVASKNAAAESAANAKASETAAASSAANAEKSAEAAKNAQDAIENMGVKAETLEPGADASVEKQVSADGTVTLKFGIPKGEKGDPGGKGDKGDKGDKGADGAGSFTVVGTTLVIKPGASTPGSYDAYDGDYSVRSTLGGGNVVLKTENKVMTKDLTVEEINRAEVSNTEGGKTLIIGG